MFSLNSKDFCNWPLPVAASWNKLTFEPLEANEPVIFVVPTTFKLPEIPAEPVNGKLSPPADAIEADTFAIPAIAKSPVRSKEPEPVLH